MQKKYLLIYKKKIQLLVFSIDDDGPGVDKSEFQNITKPFYKIDKSRSESKSSVGLRIIYIIRYHKISWRRY